MSTFTRKIVGIVLLVGLCFVTGCLTSNQGMQMPAAKTNIFSWQKTTKEPQKEAMSMEGKLSKTRVR
jgi:hypothetical protein